MREFAAVVLGGCVTALHATTPPATTTAAPFALPDQTGATVTVHGPTVLVFYRGHW